MIEKTYDSRLASIYKTLSFSKVPLTAREIHETAIILTKTGHANYKNTGARPIGSISGSISSNIIRNDTFLKVANPGQYPQQFEIKPGAIFISKPKKVSNCVKKVSNIPTKEYDSYLTVIKKVLQHHNKPMNYREIYNAAIQLTKKGIVNYSHAGKTPKSTISGIISNEMKSKNGILAVAEYSKPMKFCLKEQRYSFTKPKIRLKSQNEPENVLQTFQNMTI